MGAAAIIYIAGLYLAGPFGQIILRLINPQLALDDAASDNQVACKLGARFAAIPWSFAFALELVSEVKKATENTYWSLWSLEGVLLRSCMDRFLIIGVMWGIGRAVSLVWR